jgi:hypothetical protein
MHNRSASNPRAPTLSDATGVAMDAATASLEVRGRSFPPGVMSEPQAARAASARAAKFRQLSMPGSRRPIAGGFAPLASHPPDN